MSLEIETDRGDSDREARTAPAMSPEMAAVLDSAEAFVEQARLRLALAAMDEVGDHILNPDMGPFAFAKRPPRDAAVLIPVVDRPAGASIILTQRTDHLTSHAGQISLPGGKIDPEDNGPIDAALREANEEIGLAPRAVQPVGVLPTYLTGSGYRVAPVLGLVSPKAPIRANPDEVAEIFEVPLRFLMNDVNHRRQSRIFAGKPRYFYAMPYGERYIWGVTAGILRLLYDTVCR
ncbi:8-oxo-dGTP pyrophosphatase MutT, NUDIX family [Stappia indica]|uniref:8-oxo-dGTP pyrophosphatase MutT, NUDIX family n=2 Tax=Stappia indica TaxID=538381 RepID=A0A285R980_9HYPH|nr:CoA pyrophosphatase [Stappia indica]SOB90318.1 8-oxo-dGTP pyrophosphatase MutT, NUDIX family [Stappia indica]